MSDKKIQTIGAMTKRIKNLELALEIIEKAMDSSVGPFINGAKDALESKDDVICKKDDRIAELEIALLAVGPFIRPDPLEDYHRERMKDGDMDPSDVYKMAVDQFHQALPDDQRKGHERLNKKEQALHMASKELHQITKNWPSYNSAHEGFAVLLEEVDELKQHVWANQKKRNIKAMQKEAIQVAAVALRFAAEVCDEETGRK